jgi:hypothetical protein
MRPISALCFLACHRTLCNFSDFWKRMDILGKAALAFAEDGYHQTSVNSLAARLRNEDRIRAGGREPIDLGGPVTHGPHHCGLVAGCPKRCTLTGREKDRRKGRLNGSGAERTESDLADYRRMVCVWRCEVPFGHGFEPFSRTLAGGLVGAEQDDLV